MSNDQKPESVPHRTADLPCGCRITFPFSDMSRGRLRGCQQHARMDPFEQLHLIQTVSDHMVLGDIMKDYQDYARLHPKTDSIPAADPGAGEAV
jgi:hypothetical protein